MEQAQYDNRIGKPLFDSYCDESQSDHTCLWSFHYILLPPPAYHDKGFVLGDNECSIDSLGNKMHGYPLIP